MQQQKPIAHYFRHVGYVWAFPITFIGIFYALFLMFFGWCKWYKTPGYVLCFVITPTAPSWVRAGVGSDASQVMGNVAIMKNEASIRNMIDIGNAQSTAKKFMLFGVLYPFILFAQYIRKLFSPKQI